jgi:tetratricopeptide (TPR) repeat protein
MSPRLPTLLILTGILGCQVSPAPIANPDETRPAVAEVAAKPVSTVTPPSPAPVAEASSSPADYLTEASRCLERDDLKSAGAQLASYLNCKPEAMAVRVQYAEVLAALNQHAEALGQFNQFLVLAQEQKTEASATTIHVYRRLMEVAEESHDEYGLHLYRGIGLFLLAQSRAGVGSSDLELPVEGLLCKSAAELTQAHDAKPGEAQASWYLYQVWSRLGQRHAALAHLIQAREAAPFTYLSPAESRKLTMACLELSSERGTH